MTAPQPLLVSARAEQAREAIRDITSALDQGDCDSRPGLAGDAACAVLLARCGHPSAAVRLDAALRSTAEQRSTISLFNGLSGLGWVVHELAGGDEAADLLAHFDAALLHELATPVWIDRLELLNGLAGIGASLAGRRDDRAHAIADRVLFHLEAQAIPTTTGITWRVPANLLTPARRAQHPDGVFDLGVAHGVAGIIGMLAQFVTADLHRSRSRGLLEAAVAWLLTEVPDATPRFGNSWPCPPDEPKRLGWCAGDPGIAGVLLHASRALDAPALADTAVDLLVRLSSVIDERRVVDTSLCHGAAGLFHLHHLAYRQTGDPRMRTQADRWLAELLRRRTPGRGIAGYATRRIVDGAPTWEADTSLLTGAVGVGLALLAAVEPGEPTWQAVFGL